MKLLGKMFCAWVSCVLLFRADIPTAQAEGNGGCVAGSLGGSVDCGGGFTVTIPGSFPPPAPPPHPVPIPSSPTSSPPTTTPTPPPLVLTVAQGPNGPCIALTAQNAAVLAAYQLVHIALCPPSPVTAAPPTQVVNPTTIAVNFWNSIPLPVPAPRIPPGYALAGEPAYLVTGGTTNPAPFTESTPLGPLTVTATGSYMVDWGDPSQSGLSGPYAFEGTPYPNGQISHVYDNSGSYNVVVTENWTANWTLGGLSGQVGGLSTKATIASFQVKQLQTIFTN